MKELEMLVSEEAKHRTARVLTARDNYTPADTLDATQMHDQARIRTLSACKTEEHGEAAFAKFMKLRAAELMFEFSRAANIAAEYGDVERMRAYETLAEEFKSPLEAVRDYVKAKERSPDDAYARTHTRAFLETG